MKAGKLSIEDLIHIIHKNTTTRTGVELHARTVVGQPPIESYPASASRYRIIHYGQPARGRDDGVMLQRLRCCVM